MITPAPTPPPDLGSDDEIDDYEYDDPNDPYLQKINFKSIRTNDGLETAIQVQWLDDETTKLYLSTVLEEADMAPIFAGAQWAGTRVWHAAIAMVHYLTQEQQSLSSLSGDGMTTTTSSSTIVSPNSTLLELGCGLGVPGMLCHALYGCETYLTDQECILSQLIHNVKQNFDSSPDPTDPTTMTAADTTTLTTPATTTPSTTVHTKSGTIHAVPLTWSKDDPLLHEIDFSIVLNCDCIYEPLYGESWKSLVTVLETILERNPMAIVLTSVERRRADGVDKFLHCMETSSVVSKVVRVWNDDEFNIEIYQTHGIPT